MTNKNHSYAITSYIFTSADNLLFDANIWLYIYGPQGNPADWKTRAYSNALASVLRANSSLYVEVLILSEFINRYARLEHNLWVNQGKAHSDFKSFRNSAYFQPIASAIINDVRRILSHCHRTEDGFETLDINSLLGEYERGKSDFNDQVLTALCRARDFTLITHDSDFKDKGLTVITANNNLLV
jgi:predicted nucleic acid-binding protein